MKKQTLGYFVLGIMIAFTIAILTESVILAAGFETAMVPVSMIWQSFALAVICSLINLVYQSERLKFVWKSIIGYVLTTAAIMTCILVFGWMGIGGSNIDLTYAGSVMFIVSTLSYLVTWLIIWRVNKAKAKKLNEKLNEYKQRQ